MRPSRVALTASCVAVAAVGGLAASSLAASGVIETVAGTGFSGSALNGTATSVALNAPADVAASAGGGFYVVDTANGQIRLVRSGQITTVAGGSTGEDGEGGPVFDTPLGVAQAADGTLFVTDRHRVQSVSATSGIDVVAGDGTAGNGGDDGPAGSARLNTPGGIAVLPSGGVVVADTGNHLIRKIENGIISIVAGRPAQGFRGDGGPAVDAELSRPTDVAVLADGDLLIADTGNGRVRRVEADDDTISTVAGGGTATGDGGRAADAVLEEPASVVPAADGGFAVSVAGSHRVRRVLPDGTITTLAGTGTAGDSGDGGAATAATLDGPSGLAVGAAGRLLVADRLNHKVREIDVDLLAAPAPTPTTATEPAPTPTTATEPEPTPTTETEPEPTPTTATEPEPTTPAEPAPARAEGSSAAAATQAEPAGDAAPGSATRATAPSADAAQAPEAPVLGRAVVVAPVAGTILIRRPGADAATRLAAGEQIPVGSLLDARRGTVALTSALPGGSTQTGRFGGGRFSVSQPAGGGGVTELVLRGPELGACRRASGRRTTTTARAAARRRKPARRLWGEDKGGRFRTRGRNSVATVRGTRWLTEDTCAGTLTRVVEGAVDVYDVHRRVTRRVAAGRSVLVRVPAARPAAR